MKQAEDNEALKAAYTQAVARADRQSSLSLPPSFTKRTDSDREGTSEGRRGGVAEPLRSSASRNRPFGLCQVEAFGNSFLARIIHERFCCNRRSAATTSLRPAGSPLGPSPYCTSTHRVLTAPRAGLATRLSDFATNRHE